MPGAEDNESSVKLTVAVSCYNEADFIGTTLDTVVRSVSEIGCTYEIIVVDDASRDNSVLKVQQYISSHPDTPIGLQANSINRGLGNIFVDAAFSVAESTIVFASEKRGRRRGFNQYSEAYR